MSCVGRFLEPILLPEFCRLSGLCNCLLDGIWIHRRVHRHRNLLGCHIDRYALHPGHFLQDPFYSPAAALRSVINIMQCIEMMELEKERQRDKYI